MLSVYKASAGSGKTFTLAREYIRLLLSTPQSDERAHSHILAVTFTKKATAEMKSRILSELFTLATTPKQSAYYKDFAESLSLSSDALRQLAQSRLYGLLQDYTHFAVSTIDGFFQQIVRSFARELGLPAMYNLTLDSQEVISEAVDDLFFAISQGADSQTDSSTWLSEYALQNIHEGKRWNPKDDIARLAEHLLSERLQAQLQSVRPILTNKELLRSYKAELQAIVDRGTAEWYRKRNLPPDVLERKRDYNTALAILHNLDALGLLSDVAAQIALTNREQRRLPISDINLLLNRVIDHSDTPFIYEKIGTRIRHYMIDEFQDTSLLQWENFRPLVSEANASGRSNLIVGDSKQSIYRWRNSDWHLLEGVDREIHPSTLPKMDTNFRSAETVVSANNHIFELYSHDVANRLEAEFGLEGGYGDSIRQAYSTPYQKAKRSDLSGYVRLEFASTERKSDTEVYGIDRLLATVSDATRRGYSPGQIAVLIRNRREAQIVSHALIEAGYEVQSADGLLVAAHPAIEVLICLLSLAVQSDDEMLTARLRLALASHRYPDDTQEALRAAMSDEQLISDDEKEAIRRARSLPLPEAVQLLIDSFHLAEWRDAQAYITTFLDIIYSYCENQIADLAAFLTYWQRHQGEASIPSSDSGNAIRVMTIFKSKGLEFDIVVIPFLTWPMAAGKKDAEKMLWCKPSKAPFDAIPLLPITASKAMADTHFAAEFAAERRDLYMDNLNLTYVAFTRPKRELYAFGQMAPTTAKGADSISSVGNLLSVLLRDELNEEGVFEAGSPTTQSHDTKKTTAVDTTLPAQYQSVEIGGRLRLRTHARADEELSLQDFGTLMHDLLSEIEREEDAAKAVTHYLYCGRAREEDKERIDTELTSFFTLVEGRHWFDNTYTVLREQDILSTSGNVYRPDRIMIRGTEAIVIDYKFGAHRRQAYQEQVRNYMNLLSGMGYTARGYLVYVTLRQIEEV